MEAESKIANRLRWITAAFGIGAVVISLISSLITFSWKREQLELPARIQLLTGSLNSAAETIGQIEAEIKQRQELVRQLEKDAETASKLAALNKEQMDAVAQVLRSEIKSDQSQNFWGAQFLAFFYAALGVALSEGYRFFIRWRLRRKLQPVERISAA
jgi:hypothetical protein